MAIETELKLRIAPEHLAGLKRHAVFKAHQITAPVTRRLYNVYYDTPKLELHKNRMALRLRHSGGIWLQTLKGGGQARAGLHQRCEWEVPVPSARLDFTIPDASVWDEHLPPSLRKKLHPVFITDFYRTSRLLDWQGTQIEVCMDRGEVKTPQHSMPICELELELKSGDPQHLFELALALLEKAPFELEAVSKAEYGFRLLSGYIEQPVKGVLPKLARTERLSEVLQTLIWACLQHLQSNLHGVLENCVPVGAAMDTDVPEYLHQMRVALRRLRVVLRMTRKIRADEQSAALSREVAALGSALGRIREWDVFIADIAEPMCARMPGHAGLQTLLALCERQRADSYAVLRGTVQAREWQRLILRFAIWMKGWQQAEQDTFQTDEFAAGCLRKLDRRYIEAAQRLNAADPEQLHALRIVAKKLRYSAEFFTSLYDRRKAQSYLAALGKVQEVLGQSNDIETAHRLLDELATKPELSAHQGIIVLTRGWIANNLSIKFNVLNKTIQRLTKQQAFWEK